ncbi:YheV family putative zinc ribbon protein [Celerinatantimonas sp. YJH-8]|uniref:YheV family putative zinc ribbon protein n=1 Tax=Celerinatantimonas sp. YJH-8 TaxID=3228714 RepID=UPI0038CBE3C6
MKHRFIAGAECPQCHELDSLKMTLDHQQHPIIECVSCGFKADLAKDPVPQIAAPGSVIQTFKL